MLDILFFALPPIKKNVTSGKYFATFINKSNPFLSINCPTLIIILDDLTPAFFRRFSFCFFLMVFLKLLFLL